MFFTFNTKAKHKIKKVFLALGLLRSVFAFDEHLQLKWLVTCYFMISIRHINVLFILALPTYREEPFQLQTQQSISNQSKVLLNYCERDKLKSPVINVEFYLKEDLAV